jgi:hypothetical protein
VVNTFGAEMLIIGKRLRDSDPAHNGKAVTAGVHYDGRRHPVRQTRTVLTGWRKSRGDFTRRFEPKDILTLQE